MGRRRIRAIVEDAVVVEVPRVVERTAIRSELADPSKFTVNGAIPVVGSAVIRAVGGWFATPKRTRWMAPSLKFT